MATAQSTPQEQEAQARQELQAHHLRVTPARLMVLALLAAEPRALSHRDLEEALPEHDRATLYRTLQSFEEKGLVHRVLDETGRAFFALHTHCTHTHGEAHPAPLAQADPHQHVHFKCKACGSLICLEELPLPALQVPTTYQVAHTEVLVHGLCPSCSARGKA